MLGDSFYDSVLRELVAALGAALFFGNLWALYRRRADAQIASQRTVARNRPVDNKWIGQRIADPDIDMATIARGQGATGFGPCAGGGASWTKSQSGADIYTRGL